jgi:hypothetical protein
VRSSAGVQSASARPSPTRRLSQRVNQRSSLSSAGPTLAGARSTTHSKTFAQPSSTRAMTFCPRGGIAEEDRADAFQAAGGPARRVRHPGSCRGPNAESTLKACASLPLRSSCGLRLPHRGCRPCLLQRDGTMEEHQSRADLADSIFSQSAMFVLLNNADQNRNLIFHLA